MHRFGRQLVCGDDNLTGAAASAPLWVPAR
jgi:hypothetical protein